MQYMQKKSKWVLLVVLGLLVGCGQAAQIVPTTTIAPVPTSEPTVAKGVFVNEVPFSGMNLTQVTTTLATMTLPKRELTVMTGDITHTLTFTVALDQQATADVLMHASVNSHVEPEVRFDNNEIQQQIATLNTTITATSGITVTQSDDSFNVQFVSDVAKSIDAKSAEQSITSALASNVISVTLPLVLSTTPVQPTPEQLTRAVTQMAQAWPGIVGVYVYNLDTDEVVTQLNEKSVFSGASVMKVPILIHAYSKIKEFNDKQKSWMQRMIVDSDNLAANKMLATSVDGDGTEAAYLGTQDMNKMFKSLGLAHTYQNLPYEGRDFLVGVLKYDIVPGPKIEGPAPNTDADPMLRTTPAEMSKVFTELYRCSQAKGELLKLYPDTMNPDRCDEILALMHDNADNSRIISGLPADAYVSHKSGWIEDMQADVGIITTPDKQHFLMAIYVYRDIAENGGFLLDSVASPAIGGFAKLIYSSFVPLNM
ncbi:MAG: class A beta-lactamase-related serine hydrolase [Chloroflexales bacterium]|nr:class A beta-lactamase-related serine hydrolase [Chloroflexales bacterium]